MSTATAESALSPADSQWHERRRSVVGASEVGLLFGLPSYGSRTIADLWFQKKYGYEREPKGNASTALGNRLEPVILGMAEDHLGSRIIDRQRWCVKEAVGATLDGIVAADGAVIDAKTAGILGPSKLAEWGEDGSDDCPDNYVLQLQTQMIVTGAELGYIAALIGGRGFALFKIMPQAALMAAIEEKAMLFVESLRGELPPDEPPQLETLKRIRRQPNKVLDRSDDIEELWEQLTSAKSDAKATENIVEKIQRQLLAKLGDAEAAQTSGGMITYFEQTNKYPAKLASEVSFRVLRFKKGG